MRGVLNVRVRGANNDLWIEINIEILNLPFMYFSLTTRE